MEIQMPNLISFAIYDGIPPKEEGQDPTIFWYYPHSIPKDSQLNEIGLYMTFTGFCRDFRSSQDCEYFQTDKSLTVFINMGADVFAAARFETDEPLYHRSCQQAIKIFNRIYTMFFPSPYRLPDDSLDEETLNIFNTYLDEMINLFKNPPFVGKMGTSLELWTFCEEIFSDIKSENPLFRFGAILYNEKVVHSTMPAVDLLSLLLCHRSDMPKLFSSQEEQSQNSEPFKWIMKNFQKPLKLSSTTGIPVILSYQQRLLIILIFSKVCDFSPIQMTIEPLLKKYLTTFKATADLEEKQTPSSFHEENNMITIWPSRPDSMFGNPKHNEILVDFLGSNNNQFVRLCGTSEKNSWTFLERANGHSTFIDIQGKSMSEAMTYYTDFRKTSHYT